MTPARPITKEEREERVRWAKLGQGDEPLATRKHIETILFYEAALSRAEEANGKLVEALRDIANGDLRELPVAAFNANWREFSELLQGHARAALARTEKE